MEEITQIGRGKLLDGLECIQSYFKLYIEIDWEPVKVLEGGGFC